MAEVARIGQSREVDAGGMGLLFALLVVLAGSCVLVVCLGTGVWNLAVAARRTTADRGRMAARGAAKLAAAVLLVVVPWLAAAAAEASTGWSDDDGDGMLDGFANGAYDWMDVNGGAWAVAAAVLVTMIVAGLAVALALLQRPDGE